MIDTHNDLLTIAYCCYLKNDYRPLIEFNKLIKEGNIKGIIANLYFMSLEEMNDELGSNYFTTNTIIDMFKISKRILNEYIPDVDFKYSIEGCDYLEKEDLEILKQEGLSAIILCWNNPNKYGSGNRQSTGLTHLGYDFLKEAMRLNLVIDISHASKETCMDILKLIKDNNYPYVYASHSNIRTLFEHGRNLDDEQLDMLRQVKGKLGLVAINYFCTDEDEYIEHIKYATDKLGIDNVMIATDNMDFIDDEFKDMKLFDYQLINKRLRHKLQKYFKSDEIDQILYGNAKEIFKVMEENEYDRYKINKGK